MTSLPKKPPPITTLWRRFDELSASVLYDLLRFRQQIFVVEQRCAYPDLDGLDLPAWHASLLSGGRLAGYARVIPAKTEIRIGRVAVSVALRGQGLGRRLTTEALAFCGERYPELPVVLSAQAHLVKFYGSFGFAPTGEPFDDFGLSHVDMKLPPRS